MITVRENCVLAKQAAPYLLSLTTAQKNEMLSHIAKALVSRADEIISANKIDLETNAEKPKHILDRLMLNETRIAGMSEGLLKLIELDDPVGEVVDDYQNYAQLNIKKVRVPFGVIGIIYEARPNVTVDAIGLCLKTSNAVVLRGSRDAVESNKKLVAIIQETLENNGFKSDFIQLVLDLSHESSSAMMTARGLIDVLIPRGSARLIQAVVENSTVPIIETGTGNCHAYVHESADKDMAIKLIHNGKLRRLSVCNATESILIDESVYKKFLPDIIADLTKNGVIVYGCEKTCSVCDGVTPATDEDYATEYLGLAISCKVVKDYKEAVEHINKYGSSHSDTIIAKDESAVAYFQRYVDSAAVYHNVST
ncbi:MAG: glutamate-5-semialdehyde dehydrogenase, partial [Clostridia bacterium]|nr:glutamate-5-semialdehyde dehydrogenase [Clostridia bacterium]